MAGSIQSSPGVALTPTSTMVALPTNYITDFDYLSQYLPETYEKEFAKYGKQTIASFLRLTSSEIASTSDLIKWSEEGRLHQKYTDLTTATADAQGTSTFVSAAGSCTFRVNQTVFISNNATDVSAKAIISSVTPATGTFIVRWYEAAGQPAGMNASTALTAFVYGSEFKKGSDGMDGALEAEVEIFDNKPIIIKDKYEVSGSDMAQKGWIEVEGGYLWYLKSEHNTRKRFEDYLEMSMIEGVEAENGSAAEAYLSGNTGGGNAGTQGLIDSIETRGNVWAAGNPTALADWDSILKRLDKQGAIQQNIIFNDRDMSIAVDDMLGAIHSATGPSYGMFDNSADMALNLGFDGFRRGSYDFYKTDWKYLNDATLRGGITGGKVNGILVPAGTKNVYDEVMGESVTRPFLHVRYRASKTEDRRYKTWILGSSGGARTSAIDKMEVHFLSERALCTMGANNFFIFKG